MKKIKLFFFLMSSLCFYSLLKGADSSQIVTVKKKAFGQKIVIGFRKSHNVPAVLKKIYVIDVTKSPKEKKHKPGKDSKVKIRKKIPLSIAGSTYYVNRNSYLNFLQSLEVPVEEGVDEGLEDLFQVAVDKVIDEGLQVFKEEALDFLPIDVVKTDNLVKEKRDFLKTVIISEDEKKSWSYYKFLTFSEKISSIKISISKQESSKANKNLLKILSSIQDHLDRGKKEIADMYSLYKKDIEDRFSRFSKEGDIFKQMNNLQQFIKDDRDKFCEQIQAVFFTHVDLIQQKEKYSKYFY